MTKKCNYSFTKWAGCLVKKEVRKAIPKSKCFAKKDRDLKRYISFHLTQKKKEYTTVTFKLDFQRFNMPNEFNDDIIALLKKRVYDLAGCVKNGKVFLNGERLKIKNFKEYA
ncbi:hypothetical protein RclHR1_09340012 [Rhizophagus clarus]|uniref:DNA topoisomerase (ATP-hydrolyzing) n=1 Tax=Rhizophagus clarus TaxID=94130 RepID=A0A2Z6SA67_9GLOM|nr:hypothetical protein RclHR1_12570004 [Rhizophagus clarus]GBC10113.1 hypothetical protein RclHR1_09340012 [Rhizophagus clarus]